MGDGPGLVSVTKVVVLVWFSGPFSGAEPTWLLHAMARTANRAIPAISYFLGSANFILDQVSTNMSADGQPRYRARGSGPKGPRQL